MNKISAYCFFILITLVGCAAHNRKLQKKKCLANIWKLTASPGDKGVFNRDTLNLISCDFCSPGNPINPNPTFVFDRFKLVNRKEIQYTDIKQAFLFCLSPQEDSLGTTYYPHIMGRWRIRDSKKRTQLVLKHIKEKKSFNLFNKNKVFYTIAFLDKDKMVLVKP
jgi:hypothetical protein